MKYIHRPKAPKRGVAIELAINVMAVAVAFGGLLLSIILLQTHQTKTETRQFENKLEFMQMGEDIISELKNDPAPNSIKNAMESKYAETDYKFNVENANGGAVLVTVTEGESADALLELEFTPIDGGNYKITKWK